MKKTHISKILEQHMLPQNALENFIKTHIVMPIFKTSSKKMLNEDSGKITRVCEYFCTHCNKKFTTLNESEHYVVCPHCDLEDSAYNTHIMLGITEDFHFNEEIKVKYEKSKSTEGAG